MDTAHISPGHREIVHTQNFHEQAPVGFERRVASVEVYSALMWETAAKSECICIKRSHNSFTTIMKLSFTCNKAALAYVARVFRRGG